MSSPTIGFSEKGVLNQVISVLEMITSERDTAFSGGVRPETRLVRDLDCDSTDLVAFGMQLEIVFGRRDLGLERLLMKDGRYRDDLCVGEVVSFLCGQLQGKEA
jgi:acyl carrier protein